MNRKQSIVFAVASGILGLWFYALWKLTLLAFGGSCAISPTTDEFLFCALKHTVYGSFMTIFIVLTIAFIVSIGLATKKKK